jgi:hypothetical protein
MKPAVFHPSAEAEYLAAVDYYQRQRRGLGLAGVSGGTGGSGLRVTGMSEERFDFEGDEVARQFFLPADLKMTPEEYAARHGHEWACFALHRYRYRDPALGNWIRRLAEVLFTAGELERCQQYFLTPQELQGVREREAEEF